MSRGSAKRMAIAFRLRLAREMAGLSQSQVAKMLDLQRPSISEAEAGRRRITAEELGRLGQIYDVNIAWLIAADDDEPSPESARIELAARELAKLSKEDLERLLGLLRALRKSGGKE